MQCFKRVVMFLCIGMFITSCIMYLPSLPIEKRSEKVAKAESFQPLSYRSNVYLRLNSGNSFPIIVSINGQDLGVIYTNHYINFTVPPGEHHIKATRGMRQGQFLVSEFDLNVTESSVVLIQCENAEGFGTIVRTSRPVLQNKSMCSESELIVKNGVSVCIKSYVKAEVGEILSEPWASCALVDDKQVFLDSVLVKANKVTFKEDLEIEAFSLAKSKNTTVAYQTFLNKFPLGRHAKQVRLIVEKSTREDYLRAEQVHTVAAYEQFLSKYPTGHYSVILMGKVQALRTSEQAGVLLQRYKKLPLQIKKDKMMLTMTGHLKRQQYQESLPYFEALNRLRIKLSPSFTYFWGEALVRSGQKKRGLGKLYAYINEVGASGQYYSQALTLSNEVEQ